MLTDRSFLQTAGKLERLAGTLRKRIFTPVGKAEVLGCYQTAEPLHQIPDAALFGPVPERWGGEGVYGWFQMRFTAPEDLAGKALFLYPHIAYYDVGVKRFF